MKASELKEMVANALYGVIRWTVSTATTDAKTRWVGVDGHAVDPSDPESQWSARLVQHFGFASSPPNGSELITASIGTFHVGVEQKWWKGLASCTASSLKDVSATDLLNPDVTVGAVIRCDAIAWQMFGISMAGWNAILSIMLALVWLRAAYR